MVKSTLKTAVFELVVEERWRMQWLILGAWCAMIWYGTLGRTRWLRPLIALGLLGAMGMQITLLWLDGLFTWEAVLPLHLCSLFGVLSIPALWYAPVWLVEALCFLGSPGAFLTLFFPAAAYCSRPLLMHAAFYQLHALVALMPFFFYSTGKPLPFDPRRTLILGNGYLVLISLINRLFGTNYLFLRAAPLGTPLAWLFEQGTLFYLCALEMLCMLVFSLFIPLYAHFRK